MVLPGDDAIPRHPFEQRLARALRELAISGPVIAAVSGGADSVALLLGLAALELPGLVAASFDHGLRPGSADDRAWVAALCRERGIPCRLGSGALQAGAGESIESAARAARYAFLEEAAREAGAGWVLTGHSADDQAETVLWRVITGAGLDQVAGMPAARALAQDGSIRLGRPLLGRHRSEIRQYLDDIGAGFRRDPSNADLRFLRNKLRREVLPALRQLNPRLTDALLGLARDAREAGEALRPDAAPRSLADWRRLSSAARGRALRRAIGAPVSRRLRRELDRLIEAEDPRGWRVRLPGGRRARVEDGALVIDGDDEEAAAGPANVAAAPLSLDETTDFAGWRLRMRILPKPADRSRPPPCPKAGFAVAWLDGKIVSRPFSVRHRRPGDRIRPLGMSAGSQPLKKLFQARDIPADQRREIPIVLAADQIVWVVGAAIDDRVKVTAESQTILEITAEAIPS